MVKDYFINIFTYYILSVFTYYILMSVCINANRPVWSDIACLSRMASLLAHNRERLI